MNTNEQFEELIQNDEALNKLLIEKDVNIFTNFSKGNYTQEFKEYIEDRYLATFKEIYEKHMGGENPGKIPSLIKSVEFLSTLKNRDAIAEILVKELEVANQNLEAFKPHLSSEEALITNGNLLDDALSPMVILILNKFDDYDSVKEHKDKFLVNCFEINNAVASANPKKYPFKYAVHNAVMNNLEKVERMGEHKERFGKHHRRIEQKRTGVEVKYYLGVAVVVILIILRILSRLS